MRFWLPTMGKFPLTQDALKMERNFSWGGLRLKMLRMRLTR